MECTVAGGGFAERLVRLVEAVEVRNADSDEVRDDIYRLRYEAYVREGMVRSMASRRLSDAFDDTANAWTFGLYFDDRLAASIRINVASQSDGPSPATRFFPDLLDPEIRAGRIIVDPNRLVTDQATARAVPELAYLAVRLGYVAEQHFGADMVTATVRAEHRAFYKRVFNLRAECQPRFIPPIEKPFCLMTSRTASAAAIMRRYPCFRSTEDERTRLFGPRAPWPAHRPQASEPLNLR